MSAVPPNFRKKSALNTMRERNQSVVFPSDIASPDNGGNLRWSLLSDGNCALPVCSIQSSKATSILPSRKFSPATFSLFIRKELSALLPYSPTVCTPPRQCFLSVIVILNCTTIFFFVNRKFALTSMRSGTPRNQAAVSYLPYIELISIY